MALAPAARPGSAKQRLEQADLPLAANSPSLPSVWWPMPRLGVVTARRKAGSSSWLTSRRSQAHRSLISARSKKLCPPDTLYGICAARSFCSNTRAWWLARYRMAKSLRTWSARCPLIGNRPALRAQAWMKATARSASCSSPSHSTRRTGSPSPSRSTASSRRASGWRRSRCWPRAGCGRWSGSSAPAGSPSASGQSCGRRRRLSMVAPRQP
jgi:hypothetical protein